MRLISCLGEAVDGFALRFLWQDRLYTEVLILTIVLILAAILRVILRAILALS